MSAAALREPAQPGGEFEFTTADFKRIAALLYADSRIELGDAKAPLVYSRLGKRLRLRGITRFRDYIDLVEGGDAEERAALLSALTTNVTRFFREPHHLDALRRQVEEDLAPTARAGGRVRLWSAGCSLGHEPYSMAMMVLDALPEAPRLDVRILATDIDPQVIAKARTGRYDAADLQPAPAGLRARFARAVEGGVEIAPEARALISFGVLNLHEAWPMKGRFDAIFCRNVAIYFDAPTQQKLWTRFAERLTPEGRLYIGHSERAEIAPLQGCGLTMYRRRAA